jgi:hypothetical protein
MSSARSLLTDHQQQILTNFQEIADINDDDLCIAILARNQWSLEAAVNNWSNPGGSSPSSTTNPLNSTYQNSISSNRADTSRSSSGRAAGGLTGDNNTGLETANVGLPANQQGEGGGLLDLIFLPFRWLFQARPLSLNPNRDAENFATEFRRNYGSTHIPFHIGSYQSAVELAFQQSKFLLIYLHSPIHEDNDSFCRQVLCNHQFIDFANETSIVWGGNVWDPEAYGLSSQLSVTAFPFLGLLVCQSARVVQIADRVQGAMDLEPLLARLRTITGVFQAIIERTRLEAERR